MEHSSQAGAVASDQSDKRTEHRFKLASLIVPFVTLVLGSSITYTLTQYSTRIRVMKYGVSASPGLFPKPELVGKKLAITLDDRPIQNLSSVTIFVGSADQDLTDVPIHVRVAPVNGLPAKVIQSKPNLTPERFKQVSLPDIGDGSVRLGYIVNVWNRGQLIQIDLLFEGATAPDVTVDTQLKGVVMEYTPLQSKDHTDWIAPWWVPFLLGLLLGLICAWGVLVLVRRSLESSLKSMGEQVRDINGRIEATTARLQGLTPKLAKKPPTDPKVL